MDRSRLFFALAEAEVRGMLARGDGTIASAILSGLGVWSDEPDEEDVRDARAILSRATGRSDALAVRAEAIACLRLVHGERVSTVRVIRETTRVGAL